MEKTIRFNALLLLSFVSTTLFAFQLGVLDIPGRTEFSWQHTPGRKDTVFNPSGNIIDNPEHSGFLGLRLRPKYSHGPFILRGDFWLQSQITNKRNEEIFFIQAGNIDWFINDNIVFSGGVDIQHWGPGYIWNPGNPFQDRAMNFEDRVISYKRNGNLFASIDWSDISGLGATVYYVRHKLTEKLYGSNVPYQNAFVLKVYKQFDSSDAAFTYAFLEDRHFISGTYSIAASNQLELHGEFSLNSKRLTILPKSIQIARQNHIYTFENDSNSDWRPQFLLGGQYTTENQINFIFEYLYNGEAYSEGEYDRLVAAANYSARQLNSSFAASATGFLGESSQLLGSMKRHYLFARVSDDHLIDDLEAKIFIRYGIQDFGIIASGLLSYNLIDAVTLSFGGQYFGNISGSETANIPFRFVLYSGFSVLF